MSEGGAVGQLEREALDRVRDGIITALRAAQYRLLEDIADLQRLGVAQQTGDRFTERLVQELGRMNRRTPTGWSTRPPTWCRSCRCQVSRCRRG
jgi:hypothetical protein